MSGVRHVALVAVRDLVQRARSRAVIITTLIVVLVVFSFIPLAATLGRDPPPYEVGAAGRLPDGFEQTLTATAAAFDRQARLARFTDQAAGVGALEAGTVDVLVVDGTRLVWKAEADLQLAGIIGASVQAAALEDRAAALGLTIEEVSALVEPVPLGEETLEEPDPQADTRRVATNAGIIIMYMAIVIFGQFVLMGVMEEKQSRVVEVLLSRVRPHELLAGKIIGLGLLGLAQLVLIGGALLGGVAVASPAAFPDLTSIGLSVIGTVIVWFLLGFAFYAVLYGALGALVTRQEDAQSVGFLPVLPLVAAIFLASIALVEPDTVVVRIASLVPPTSPIVMPARMGVADVPVVEIAGAVVGLAIATYGLVRLGGRVYAGGVLRLGGRVRIRDAWRSAAE